MCGIIKATSRRLAPPLGIYSPNIGTKLSRHEIFSITKRVVLSLSIASAFLILGLKQLSLDGLTFLHFTEEVSCLMREWNAGGTAAQV